MPSPPDFTARSKRARGRRVYNEKRQFQALLRLKRVIEHLWETGLTTYGYQSIIAKKLGVSRATICRDVKRLLRIYHGGREADDRHRANERLKQRIRDEDAWLRVLIEAEGDLAEPDVLVDMELASPVLEEPESPTLSENTRPTLSSPSRVHGQTFQVPRWLPPSRSRSTSRTLPESRGRR